MSEFDEELPGMEDPSEELARLARETIESQAGLVDMVSARQRCQRVNELYAQGKIIDGRDYFHAAWVMLCGESLAHFQLARMFAQRATDLDEERAWTLRAMAWDRWLVAMGRPQRFGTQIVKQRGRWSLGEVDPTISDLQRAFYAVPPLFIQVQRAEQLQRQEE